MMGPEETDNLIARVAKGDREAFEGVYHSLADRLYAICLRILENQSDAEDVLLDVFASVWEDADALLGHAARAEHLLVQEARLEAIALKRARHSDPVPIMTRDLLLNVVDQPMGNSALPPDGSGMRGALAVLQPARAHLMERVLFEGEGYSDLARAADLEEHTIRVSLETTLLKMSDSFAPDAADDRETALAIARHATGLDRTAPPEPEPLQDIWTREIAQFVLDGVAPVAPPEQVFHRLQARVFNVPQETLWDDLWPYAVGGVCAALLLWGVVSSDVLIAFE